MVIIKCVEMRSFGITSVLQRNYVWRNCLIRKQSITRRTLGGFPGQTSFFKDEEMNTVIETPPESRWQIFPLPPKSVLMPLWSHKIQHFGGEPKFHSKCLSWEARYFFRLEGGCLQKSAVHQGTSLFLSLVFVVVSSCCLCCSSQVVCWHKWF